MAGGSQAAPTLKARLVRLTAVALGWLAYALPRGVSYRMADLGADLLFRLFPTYRHNVVSNMSRAAGGLGQPEIEHRARQVFRTSARNFIDMLRVPHLRDEALAATVQVSPESWANLEAGLAAGRGALLVTAHYGAFDYAGQILPISGRPVTVLTTRTVPEFIYDVVCQLRASKGMTLIEATPGGVRRVIGELRRGGMVGILSDRDFFQSGQPVEFFGARTTLPVGPARLARDTGAAIVPLFTRRLKSDFELVMDEPFHIPKTTDLDRDIRDALARIVAVFERRIGAAPEQWVMFQRVWPERPPAALRVFPIGSPLEGKILGRGVDLARPLTEAPLSEAEPHRPAPASGSQPAARPASDSSQTEAPPGGRVRGGPE